MNHPACPIPKPVAQNPKTTNNGSNPNNNKPKRPLSAFNLFYRYKRRKILRYISRGGGGGVDKDEIIRIVGTAPGLEAEEEEEDQCSSSSSSSSSPNDPRGGEDERPAPEAMEEDERRASAIRSELAGNLLPRDNRDRQHRTNESAMNGTMSFVELGKAMNASWKGCDDIARSVFDDLAEEGRRHYQMRLREYLDGAGGGGGGGPAIATATAKAKATTKAATAKAKKPTAAAGGRRRGKAGSPVELRDDVPDSTDDDGAKLAEAARGMARIASSAAADFRHLRRPPAPPTNDGAGGRIPPPPPPPAGYCRGMPPDSGHVDLRTVSADHSVASSSCHDAMPPRRGNPPPRQQLLLRPHPHAPFRGGEVPYHHRHHIHPSAHRHHHRGQQPVAGVEDVELLHRVRELEGQLAAERLLSRVRELEGEVARRIAVEGRMRAQIDELATLLSSAAAAEAPPQSADDRPPAGRQQQPHHHHHHHHREGGGGGGGGVEGLWSLVSASMIHPSMNAARERANDINATTAAAAHDRAGTSSGIGAAGPPSAPGPVAVAPPSHFQQRWMQQQQQQHHPPQHHHHNSSMFPMVHRPVRPSSAEAVRVDVLLAGAGGGGEGSSPTKKRQRRD